MRHKEKGFSLIELLQAMLIFGIVTAIVFGLFVRIKKIMEQRERRHALLQTAQGTLGAMRFSLEKASGFYWGQRTGFCYVGAEGDTHKVVWKSADSMLYRDGQKQLSGGARAVALDLTYVPSLDSLESRLLGEWFEELDLDRDGMLLGEELKRARWLKMRLVTAQGGQAFTLENAVRLPEPIIEGNKVFDQ